MTDVVSPSQTLLTLFTYTDIGYLLVSAMVSVMFYFILLDEKAKYHGNKQLMYKAHMGTVWALMWAIIYVGALPTLLVGRILGWHKRT